MELMVSPKNLTPTPLNPRKIFDLSDILESVKKHGIMVPLIVRPTGKKDHYRRTPVLHSQTRRPKWTQKQQNLRLSSCTVAVA